MAHSDSNLAQTLFKSADKLRKNIDTAEYKHIVLGLVFLKYISDSFQMAFDTIQKDGGDTEDRDEYGALNAFFDLIKRTLQKYERTQTEKEAISQSAIKQIINDAIVSEGVIDLLAHSGIAKPNLSIFSEEFLGELANHQHPNLALQTLQKLLNDELSARLASAISAQSLMERLKKTMRQYQNNLISVAEAIDELICLSKELISSEKQRQDLGLKDYEFAFYEAIAQNESAKEVMSQDTLKELAIAVFETLKKNVTLDWQHKENVRAKLRVAVKRVLRKYGYPPDMQQLAVDRVIRQAELVAQDLTA